VTEESHAVTMQVWPLAYRFSSTNTTDMRCTGGVPASFRQRRTGAASCTGAAHNSTDISAVGGQAQPGNDEQSKSTTLDAQVQLPADGRGSARRTGVAPGGRLQPGLAYRCFSLAWSTGLLADVHNPDAAYRAASGSWVSLVCRFFPTGM
jgi:hypothetical protein